MRKDLFHCSGFKNGRGKDRKLCPAEREKERLEAQAVTSHIAGVGIMALTLIFGLRKNVTEKASQDCYCWVDICTLTRLRSKKSITQKLYSLGFRVILKNPFHIVTLIRLK